MTTCNGVRLAAVLAAVAAVTTASPVARAQAQDQATARALFEQGRALMKSGQFAAACPKLDAAARAYPSAGILLNLGDCYEKTGRTASAWTEFGEAASVAGRTNRPDDAAEGHRRQAALEPSLTRVVLHIARAVPGLLLERDGAPVAGGAWGVPIPVDPGSHDFRASADGYQSWSATQDIEGRGQTVVVEIPQLQPVPVAAAPESSPAPAPTGPSRALSADATPAPASARPSRTVPLALVVAGAAVAVAGGATWIVGWRQSVSASEGQGTKSRDDWQSARTVYWTGVAVTGVGAAVAIVGAVLLGTSGSGAPAPVGLSASPWVAWNAAGVSVERAW